MIIKGKMKERGERREGRKEKKSSSLVLTDKEIEVINKKLLGEKLSQQDSNYLSRYVRPKLREINLIDAKTLLSKLKYCQKALAIENKIKETMPINQPRVVPASTSIDLRRKKIIGKSSKNPLFGYPFLAVV